MNKKEKQELRDAIMARTVRQGQPIRPITKALIGGQNITTGADGGNSINASITNILPPDVQFGQLYDRVQKLNTSKNTVNVPIYDTSVVNDTGQFGANAQWLGEGESLDLSKVQISTEQLSLNKLGIVIGVTDELAQDAEFFVDSVKKKMIDSIGYQIDRALLYGNKSYSIDGIVGTGDQSTIYVSALGSVLDDVKLILNSYYGGENGVWVLSQDVYNDLINAATCNDENQSEQDCGEALNALFDVNARMLGGYPIIVLWAANNDTMVLADFSQFVIAQSEIRTSIGSSIYFYSDQKLLKAKILINGTSIWSSTMTREDGTVVAPFVALDSMNGEEESSEQWNLSTSSSSSESSGLYSESSDSSSSELNSESSSSGV